MQMKTDDAQKDTVLSACAPLGRKASTSGKPPALTSLCLGGLGVELRAL